MVARTEPDGRYHLRGVPSGAGMLLHAWAPDSGLIEAFHREEGTGREGWLRVSGGEELTGIDVVLRRGSWLRVDVLDATSRQPIRVGGAELVSQSSPLLSYLPGVRDRLLVWSGSGLQAHTDGTPAGSEPGTGAPAGSPPDGDGGSGVDPGSIGTRDGGALGRDGPLVFGPIPAGEYRVNLYPGSRNPHYLPLRIDPTSQVGARGQVTLQPGERVAITMLLVANPDVAAPPSTQPGTPERAGAAPARLPAPQAQLAARRSAGGCAPGGWPAPLVGEGAWPGLGQAACIRMAEG
jgi:hypothetical protein